MKHVTHIWERYDFFEGGGCGLLSKELKSFVHCLSYSRYLWSGLPAARFVKQVFVIASDWDVF